MADLNIVAIYAAIVSTLSLGWNIYAEGRRRRANLYVGVSFTQYAEPYTVLHLHLANRGHREITITDIRFHEKTSSWFSFSDEKLAFPFKLMCTEIRELDFPITSDEIWLSVKSIRVYDSEGRRWVENLSNDPSIKEACLQAKKGKAKYVSSGEEAKKQANFWWKKEIKKGRKPKL